MKTPIFLWQGAALGVSLLVSFPVIAAAQSVSQEPPTHVELSDAVQSQLEDAYPGAAVATVTPDTPGCAAAAPGSPLLVRADFDNDGLADYGVVITTPGGTPQVLAMLPRVNALVIHELGSWTPSSQTLRLHVLPMGRKFRAADATLDDYFSAPTLAAGTCTEATTAYLWTGLGFRATPLRR